MFRICIKENNKTLLEVIREDQNKCKDVLFFYVKTHQGASFPQPNL